MSRGNLAVVLVLMLVASGCQSAEPADPGEVAAPSTSTTAPASVGQLAVELPELPAVPPEGPLFGEDFAKAPAPAPGAKPVEIVIVHTNDLHGQVYPQKAIWLNRNPAPDAGGVGAIASVIRAERDAAAKEGKGFLALDAGDIWSGTPEANLTEGRVMVHWMNLAGYDALALGNHEFDAGWDRVEPLARGSKFPWLAANFVDQRTGTRPPWVRGAVDRLIAGVKVTIVGVIASDTKMISAPRATQGFDFKDAVDAARDEVKAARARGAEVVIVLSHCGIETDRQIAGSIGGVDVVIGGHTHQGIEGGFLHPRTKTLVAATFSKGSTVGRVTLTVEKRESLMKAPGETRRVTARSAKLIQLLTDEWPRDAETDALLERQVSRIHARMQTVIGETPDVLRRERGFASSAIGNWIADILRDSAGAQVAVHNKAGVRADIAAGPIRATDLYQISPFGNTAVSMTLSGEDLRVALEYALTDTKYGVEVSGVEVRYDAGRPSGDRIVRLRLSGGEPVDPKAKYRVATNSFLAKGGDGHVTFTRGEDRKDHGVDLWTLHADDVARRKVVKLAPEARLAPAEETTPGAAAKQ